LHFTTVFLKFMYKKEEIGDYMFNQSLRERFDVDKKNYSIISRIIRETFEAGFIKEYEKSRMYVPYWAG
jgi:ATP-dependent DNA helicase RecG